MTEQQVPMNLTRRKYNQQRLVSYRRVDAAGKPIEFKLTFEEWVQIWIDSGHAAKMGRGKGKYCMSRLNDLGNYEIGNVFIQDHFQNLLDSWKIGYSPAAPKSPEHKRKISLGVRRALFNKSKLRLMTIVNSLSKGE